MQSSSKKWVISGVVFLFIAIGLLVWRFLPSAEPVRKPTQQEATQTQLATLNGILAKPEIAHRRPLAVMVENHPDARPQSGLSNAEVVYEMAAEGGITRYLALFQKDSPNIGPVRSAREYYAEIADSYGALYAHVGGSPEVIAKLKAKAFPHLVDVNQFYNDSTFERVLQRAAPHNVYTSTDKLLKYLSDHDLPRTLDSTPFAFSSVTEQSSQVANKITLNFSTESYKVEFKYDVIAKTYSRFLAGEMDIDAENKKQLSPTTVIVQLTDVAEIPGDEKGRMSIRTNGSGKAFIFRNGGVVQGTWKRNQGELAKYFDAQGNIVVLNPGQIWIGLISRTNPNAVVWTSPLSH